MPASRPAYREVTRRAAWQDLRSLGGFLIVAVIGFVLASVARRTTQAFDEDLRSLLEGAPETFVHVAMVSMQATFTFVLAATPFILLWRRRPGLIVRGAIAAALGGLAFLGVSRLDAAIAAGTDLSPVDPDLGPGPSSLLIAGTAAVVATLRPVVRGAWHALLWTALTLLALLRMLSAPDAPVDVVLAIGVGGMVGTLVLLVLGRSVKELTAAGVTQALDSVGLSVHHVRLVPDGGAWRLRAEISPEREGVSHPLLVRLLDDRSWHSDSVRSRLRRFRLRHIGQGDTRSSPYRALASEAMVMMLAAELGVPTPSVRAVARAPEGEALLAVDRIYGMPLAKLAPEDLTDEVLREVWEKVDRLQVAGIAHRSLTAHHILLEDGRRVWITNFDHGDAAAPVDSLDTDTAELLASTFALVGAERAVRPALAALGHARLMRGAQRLVPAALSATTREDVKQAGADLDALMKEAAKQAGVAAPEPLAVERFKPRTLIMAALLAVSVYVLAPQFADLPKIWQAVQSADWAWLPLVLLASVATYVGCGLGLAGGTPGRVPAGEAGSVALAGSFVATFSPPGVSTVGLNIRFLQKRGFPIAVAVAASTAKEVAVGIMHVTLLVVFAVWAGSSDALSDELSDLPPANVLIDIGVGVVAVVLALLAIPRVRQFVASRVVPAIHDAADAMKPVISSPGKVIALLGGVTLIPLGYGVCLFASVRAFDSSAEFVSIVLVSLTAGAVATAAPTPGGIGAVEAVLFTALTAIGIPTSQAMPAVMLYRVATFWLPILPGFISFRMLTRRGVL